MGAACSIREFETAVIPYLKKNKKTNFYNLSLHPLAENRETNSFELLAPRGSLLTHIDNFFDPAAAFHDRTLGRWQNVIQATHIFPEEVKGQINLKAFKIRNQIRPYTAKYNINIGDFQPQKHGQFGSFGFWKKQFWIPEISEDE